MVWLLPVLPVLAGVVTVVGIAWLVLSPPDARGPTERAAGGDSAPIVVAASEAPAAVPAAVAANTRRVSQRPSTARPANTLPGPDDAPSGDPNDIATYVSPSDPEPTAAEVIEALHDVGDYGGIGAFNPPGTSPPLRGLAVPESFILPPGYVRHHQVTDAGEPLEPILMFSPDVVFVDAYGRAIPIPDDRVVPPEMAPPGLPIREIAIPPDG